MSRNYSAIDHLFFQIATRKKQGKGGVYWETWDSLKNIQTSNFSIYNGIPGIILTLIEYYEFRKNRDALDLIEEASDWIIENYKNELKLGSFYTGITGLIYTNVCVYNCTGKIRFLQFSLKLLKKHRLEFNNDSFNEFLNGIAGTIYGLMLIDAKLGSKNKPFDLKAIIYELIKKLLGNSKIYRDGIYWDESVKSKGSLCGLSHGASGIGMLLSILANRTESREILQIAQKSFNYENHFYNDQLKNWNDLRERKNEDSVLTSSIDLTELNSFNEMSAWCHGAPGIGITRSIFINSSNQLQFNRTNFYQTEIDINNAVLNIRNSYKANLKNKTYCHGLTGNLHCLSIINELIFENKYSKELEFQDSKLIDHVLRSEGVIESGYPTINQSDISLFNGSTGILSYLLEKSGGNKKSLFLPHLHELKDYKLNFDSSSLCSHFYKSISSRTLGINSDQLDRKLVDNFTNKFINDNQNICDLISDIWNVKQNNLNIRKQIYKEKYFHFSKNYKLFNTINSRKKNIEFENEIYTIYPNMEFVEENLNNVKEKGGFYILYSMGIEPIILELDQLTFFILKSFVSKNTISKSKVKLNVEFEGLDGSIGNKLINERVEMLIQKRLLIPTNL